MISKSDYMIHPFEMCICGHSGSGKTTLISKLISELSKTKRVGYIKHDAHRFEMDKKGKDTYIARDAGAFQVSINSESEFAFLSEPSEDRFFLRNLYLDCDTVLIEGYKKSLMRKVYIYSGSEEDKALLNEYLSDDSFSLIAVIGEYDYIDLEIGEIPYFQRDNISEILNFFSNYFSSLVNSTPVYGLVLSGGKSSRMGTDKGKLEYHGKTQIQYLYELLDSKLERSFVSRRSDQEELKDSFETISDRFIDFGPTGGLLSALDLHPNAAWLVVACDMPFINEEIIDDLMARRNPFRLATCFHNDERKWPEPLCTIYEPKARAKLANYLAQGKPCPRKILMNSNIELLESKNAKALNNINTPKEYEEAISELRGESL